jgi:hypothetical protein
VAVVEAEQQAIHARGKLYVMDKTVREMLPDLPYKRCVDCHHVKALVTGFPRSGEAHMRSGHARMHV